MRWQNRLNQELSQAPDEFLQAFASLTVGDNEAVEEMLAAFTMHSVHEAWRGTAACLLAYLRTQRQEYQAAIFQAEVGKKLGIQLPGYWYYYYSLSESLNYTDQLTECLCIIDEALEFFKREDSPADLSDYFYKKSNILKQLSAPLSYKLDSLSQRKAKALIVEGIRSIYESLNINASGSEQYLEQDLKPFLSIAARVLVSRDDLPFLGEMYEIKSLTDELFDEVVMAGRSAAQCFNVAQSLKNEGLRQDSAEWFDRAILVAPENEPWHKCFKAFVAYQAGVNLLKTCNLEDLTPAAMDKSFLTREIDKIRSYWQTTLRLYSAVARETVSQFDREFPPGLTDAVWNIKRDYIMQRR